MSNEYLEGILKDLYKAEVERADKLDDAVNLPAVILTGLLGVGLFYLEHLPKTTSSIWVPLFYMACFSYFAFLVVTIGCLIASYFRYKYRMLSSARDIADYAYGLRAHYSAILEDKSAIEQKVKEDVQENLIHQYVEASAQNRIQNMRRTSWLYSATYGIIGCLISLLFSRALFFAVSDTSPKPLEIKLNELPTQRIEVINRAKGVK